MIKGSLHFKIEQENRTIINEQCKKKFNMDYLLNRGIRGKSK